MESEVTTEAPPVTEPVPGSDEYNQAMATKADNANDPNPVEPDTTETPLLAGKYKTEEELHKGIINKLKMDNPDLESFYKTLEKGEPAVDTKIPVKDETKAPEADTPADGDTPDFTKYTNEFQETGELSPESYAELTKTIPKEIVDGYLEGIKGKTEATQKNIYESVGGPEKYQEMVTWAASNMTPDEITAFNEAVVGQSDYVRQLALKDLTTRFDGDSSQPPAQKIPGEPAGTTTGAYGSNAEMIADMSNPKYKTDPKFRASVAHRISKSNL